MSFLSLMEAKLPPGFRFHPRDEELVCDYLAKKVAATSSHNSLEYPMMIEVDLNKIEPWDLPEMACVGGKEWYFFSLRDRKYATGLRTNRATVSGYWKATGKDRPVIDIRQGTLVGMRKTLVFYQGRAPKGQKTDWVMHEFRLEGPSNSPKASFQEDWVLCRVFHKSRGMSAKAGQENSCDDTGSSSPPSLMDSYLSFDQPPFNVDNIEQVPCFSNFSPNYTSQTQQPNHPNFSPLPHLDTHMPTTTSFGALPDLATFVNVNPFISCDKKVIKAVLDHFSKLETNQKMVSTSCYGEGSCSNSYLSPMGLPNMWNNY